MSIIKVPIEKVYPNPYQPKSRVDVTEADAERIGKSILNFGLILTPVGRRSNGTFEVGDGWLRRKGHEWLVNHGHIEYGQMPFDVRELTDQQMADLVIEANKERKDLNPLQEAEFYARYIKEFKVTETELAKKYNVSQGEIANTLRLLELPEPVKAKVISQEISPTHGRQLLRLNKMPELQTKYLEETIKHDMSVSQLDNEMNRELWDTSRTLKPGEYNSPRFDTGACQKCDFNQMLANPWGQQKKEPRCINSKCWIEKQNAAEKALEAAAKKKLDKKTAGQKVLTDKDLHYDQYKNMEDYRKRLDNPAECEKCTKRGLYKSQHSSRETPEKVCLDPKCYQSKQTKKTKEENKTKRQLERELTVKMGQIFEKTQKNRNGALVVAARYMAKHIESAVCEDLCHMFDNLPKTSNGRLDHEILRARLPGMAEPEIVKLLAAMVISQRRRRDSYQMFSTKLSEEVLLDIAILEGTYEAKVAEVKAFQEANCKGCGNANQSLISTGERCCTYTYNQQIKDGVCLNSPAQREARKKKTGSDTRVEVEEEEVDVAGDEE
jgi:ParB family chromosome partitioning protein